MMFEVSVNWLRLMLNSLSLQASFNSITSLPNSTNFLKNTVKPAQKMFVVYRSNYGTERLTVTTDFSTVNVIVVISPLVRSAWS